MSIGYRQTYHACPASPKLAAVGRNLIKCSKVEYYMIQTKKLKIWLIVTQAFIVIGIGHGILTLGILEPLRLWALFKIIRPAEDDDIPSLYLRLVV